MKVYELGTGTQIADGQITAFFSRPKPVSISTLYKEIVFRAGKWWNRRYPFTSAERRGIAEEYESDDSFLPVAIDGKRIILPEQEQVRRLQRRLGLK